MLLVGLEGERWQVRAELPRLVSACLREKGIVLGAGIGRSWFETRYLTPYLRDTLLDRGIGIETLETATRWSNIPRLYEKVKTTIREAVDRGAGGGERRGYVMTHISHCYPDGASLYYTFVFPRRPGEDAEQFHEIKNAACGAIVKHGGTVTHHHGVGADHAPWMTEEKGELGMSALRAAKSCLDPEGIMNPGKWA
jgi:alkyldihydroxyacetonephosphate synthase